MSSPSINNEGIAGDLLTITSIIAVTACFGNFAFTYEKMDGKRTHSRIIAHLTTGLLMLSIGLSLEMISILSTILVGKLIILDGTLIILYIASVLYDFWDLERHKF